MSRFDVGKATAWAHDYRGGITLFRGSKTIYLQPGEDVHWFLETIAHTNNKWSDADVINDYFDLLGGDEDTETGADRSDKPMTVAADLVRFYFKAKRAYEFALHRSRDGYMSEQTEYNEARTSLLRAVGLEPNRYEDIT